MGNFNAFTILLLVLAAWSLLCKGIALWRAAHYKQRNWFIVLLLPINTIGILELVYLFYFAEKRLTIKEVKSWLQS